MRAGGAHDGENAILSLSGSLKLSLMAEHALAFVLFNKTKFTYSSFNISDRTTVEAIFFDRNALPVHLALNLQVRIWRARMSCLALLFFQLDVKAEDWRSRGCSS